MNATIRRLAFAACAAVFFAAPCEAAQLYRAINLGTLGGTISVPTAVNNSGQVVGWSTVANDSRHAFLYSGGQLTDLGLFGTYNSSIANSINSSGQFTITAYNFNTSEAEPLVYSGGTVSPLGFPAGDNSGRADGINSSGQIAGDAFNTSGSANQFAYYYSHGAWTSIGALPGGLLSSGFAINDSGQMAGESLDSSSGQEHAYLYSNGAMTDLGNLGGNYVSSIAFAINNNGWVVGFDSYGVGNDMGFVYHNGAMTALGDLGGNYSSSYASAINDSNQIVGYSFGSNNAPEHAILYSNGVMSDLNTMLDASSAGWTLQTAAGISNNGLIVGDGYAPNATVETAFLLVPVPEPSTWLLATLSAGGLWLARRRRR